MFPILIDDIMTAQIWDEVESSLTLDEVWEAHWQVAAAKSAAQRGGVNMAAFGSYIIEEEAEYGPAIYEQEYALQNIEDYADGYFAGF